MNFTSCTYLPNKNKALIIIIIVKILLIINLKFHNFKYDYFELLRLINFKSTMQKPIPHMANSGTTKSQQHSNK